MRKGRMRILSALIAVMAFTLAVFIHETGIRGKNAIPALPGFPSQAAPEKRPEPGRQPEPETASTLPSSLLVIDDEAFEGTALQNIQLPNSVKEIGDRAFAGNTGLSAVRLPEDPGFIGEDVFAGSENVSVTAFAGSKSMDWALRSGYPIRVMTVFEVKRAGRETAVSAGASLSVSSGQSEKKKEACHAENKEKRTGRITAELKGDLYRGTASLYVQSRYFP